MAAIKGRGVVWSTGDITFAGAIVSATAAALPQSLRLARTAESTKIKDNQGPVRAIVYHGLMATLSITVVICAPSGTNTIAAAKTAGDQLTIAGGGTVTITDDAGTVVDGPYNVLSATQNRSVDGAATVDLEMEKGDEGIDTTTLIS